MVFSFMGSPSRGRILQAYHDGNCLIIRKSQLLDFSTYNEDLFNLFLLHLASVPVGNTEEFPPRSETGQAVADGAEIPKKRATRGGIPSFRAPGGETSSSHEQSLDVSLPLREPREMQNVSKEEN